MATTNIQSGNVVTDWRSRAQIVPAEVAPVAMDWRSRAQPVLEESLTETSETPGNNLGPLAAGIQGVASAIPFGERIAAGLGATGLKLYDKTLGNNITEGRSVGDLYREARQDQEKTAEQNPGSYVTGSLGGAALTIPMLLKRAGTGVLGAVDKFARGGNVAADAGVLAKTANVLGQAGRSAAVAAPAGFIYGYGGSRHDLDSPEAFEDAKLGGMVSAGLGAAVPVARAAFSGVTRPKISKEVRKLAGIAKDKFGIDLSLDQVSPTRVRSTVQKVSQNIPFSGVDAFQEKQAAQWMRSAAKLIGEDADNLAPEVIDNYLARAAKDFEQPLTGKVINFTQKDINNIADVAKKSRKVISADLSAVVQSNVDDLFENLSQFKVGSTRNVPGEKLASLRSQIIKDLPRMEGGARQQVAEIVDAIDDIISRHLTPAEQKQLATARLQWRNFKTLDPLLQKSTDGTINPTDLMGQVAKSKYINASRKAAGEDDLVDLARIGKRFLVKKGGSDTAEKALYIKGGLGAFTGGAAVVDPITTTAGSGAAMVTNRLYQNFINQSPKVMQNLIQNKPGSINTLPIAGLLGAQLAPIDMYRENPNNTDETNGVQ